MTELIIAGAGGGGGAGKGGGGGSSDTPTEKKDNLNSTAYANVLDLLGEGEIEGFATPSKLGLTRDSATYNTALLKDIYFNNTAVLRSDADINNVQKTDYAFKGFQVTPRYGTQAQAHISGNTSIEEEQSVNIKVEQSTPVIKTITDSAVDAVRVTVNIPSLQKFTDKGDIKGSSVQLQIQVKYSGGSYATKIDDTITGRTGDAYQRDYIIELSGAFPVEIKLVRVTADSNSSKLANDLYFYSYTEIVYAKLRYPNSAYLALRIDAEQFNSIPSRAYRLRGIKVQIPSNATVDNSNGRLIYSGIWNGTFQAATWCADPAFCLWALLTNSRWGFGDYIQTAQMDKWSFYEASKYCNDLVPDGFGGTEPRFQINANIQSRQEAYKLINDMCSVMRAMPYWSTGALTVSQDKPQDPAYLFSLANVSEAGFSYSGASIKTRHTVAIVKYFDLETREQSFEVIEDQEGIQKYGVNTAEIEAFACTSRGQARRVGEWLVFTERYENEIISFTASVDAGVIVRPGQVIAVSDPVRAGSRKAGRISAATTTTVTVDDTASTDLTINPGAMLSVILPDGTVEMRQVGSITGSVITVLSAFSIAPQVNSIWMLEDPQLQSSLWRVLGIKEEDGAQYSISAVAYNPSKYDYIEQDKALTVRDTSNLNVPPNAPAVISAEEAFYTIGNRVLTKLVVSWASVKGVTSYRFRYRAENDNWIEVAAKGPSYDILEVTPGIYQIEVYAISASQILSSDPATLSFNAQGATAKPAAVTGVSLTPVSESSAILQWDLAGDLDVIVGGKVLIHHDPQTGVSASWNTSNPIVQAAAGNQTQKQIPLLDGTYFVKFEDSSGSRSATAAYVEAVLPAPQPRTTVKTWAEQSLVTPFTGVGTNMFYDGLYSGLVLDYTASFTGGIASTSYTSLDTVDGGASNTNYAALDTLNGGISTLAGSGFDISVQPTGEYVFKDTLDLGAVYDLNLKRRLVSTPVAFGSTFDDISDVDSLADIDGDLLDVVAGFVYVRSTNDDPGATPTWGAWNELVNGIVRGRGFQLKLAAETDSSAVTILVTQLGATAELQQRSEQSSTITTTAGTYTATFTNAFYAAPSVNITPLNMATGDYFVLGAPTTTGFTITFYNSSNAAVIKNFTYTAVGYGRRI